MKPQAQERVAWQEGAVEGSEAAVQGRQALLKWGVLGPLLPLLRASAHCVWSLVHTPPPPGCRSYSGTTRGLTRPQPGSQGLVQSKTSAEFSEWITMSFLGQVGTRGWNHEGCPALRVPGSHLAH